MTNKEINKKGLFAKTESLLGWISALFGCIFLILNLIVYSCLVPMLKNNKEFAVKFGTDITDYAAKANYELNEAYFTEANAWTVNQINNKGEYESLLQGLKDFEEAYDDYNQAIEDAEKAYNTAITNANEEALQDLQNAATDAENALFAELQKLGVDDLSSAYSSFKTALAEYNDVLNDNDSTAEQLSAAKLEFENSAGKVNFEALLEELRDFIIEGKTALYYVNLLNDYTDSYNEYVKNLAEFNKSNEKNSEIDGPCVLKTVENYFGDGTTDGALKNLNDYYTAYSGAVSEYESYLSAGNLFLLWSVSPLQSELNRVVVTSSDLQACQNDIITHFELYSSVINSLPYRLHEIKEYYNNLEKTDSFGYFDCTENTRNAVLGKTDFEDSKTSFNKLFENLLAFSYTSDFDSEDVLTKSFNDGLVSDINAVINISSSFNNAVTEMDGLGSQAQTLAKSYELTADILSTYMMALNIVLAVILCCYCVFLVVVYSKSK